MLEIDKTLKSANVILPLPPEKGQMQDMDVYIRFMRHLRCVPNSRATIKVLSAIQFTADFLDCSDAHVAKLLVDLGLRAPRMAFPAEFLGYADASLIRTGWVVGGPSAALTALKAYWDETGEDKFAAFRSTHSLAVSSFASRVTA
jgi:hypothetical protein